MLAAYSLNLIVPSADIDAHQINLMVQAFLKQTEFTCVEKIKTIAYEINNSVLCREHWRRLSGTQQIH
jgi:hypothetical protein